MGNSLLTETKEKNYKDFEKFTFLLLWIAGVCSCCFLGIYQPFMKLWVGENLMLEFGLVICFAVYFFIYTLNRLLNVYKDAAGLWRKDRMRPLVKAIINLSLNLLWVRRWGLYGVLVSTIVALGIVGLPWILKNLFTYLFDGHLVGTYVKLIASFVMTTGFAGTLVCLFCRFIQLNGLLTLFFLCCNIGWDTQCSLFCCIQEASPVPPEYTIFR